MIPTHFTKLRKRVFFIWVVIIVIIIVFVSLKCLPVAFPASKSSVVSNYRSLYVLTQSASLDAQAAGGKGAFPGDLSNSFAAWSNHLVTNNYCSTRTFENLIIVKGKVTNTTIYNVSSADPSNTVFLATENLDATGIHDRPPFGLKGGVLVTVDGAAFEVTASNMLSTNLIWPKETVNP